MRLSSKKEVAPGLCTISHIPGARREEASVGACSQAGSGVELVT